MAKVEEVKTKTENGEDLVLDVCFPSGRQMEDANVLYSIHWREYLKKGVSTKKEIDKDLAKRGIWTKEDEDKEKALWKEIEVMGKKLKSAKKNNGHAMSKMDGRRLAIDIHNKRMEIRDLLAARSVYDANSAEALAENVRFDYLVSVCALNSETGEPYFENLENYQNRKDEKAAWAVARKLATMIYGGSGLDFSEDFEKNVMEIQFLKKFGFINDEGRFVEPKSGKPMNSAGEILEHSDDVDIFGNKITEDGRVMVEFGEFADEEEESLV